MVVPREQIALLLVPLWVPVLMVCVLMMCINGGLLKLATSPLPPGLGVRRVALVASVIYAVRPLPPPPANPPSHYAGPRTHNRAPTLRCTRRKREHVGKRSHPHRPSRPCCEQHIILVRIHMLRADPD